MTVLNCSGTGCSFGSSWPSIGYDTLTESHFEVTNSVFLASLERWTKTDEHLSMEKLGTGPVTWISIDVQFTMSTEATALSKTTAVFSQLSIMMAFTLPLTWTVVFLHLKM